MLTYAGTAPIGGEKWVATKWIHQVFTAQFTCFTGTKVQILTREELQGAYQRLYDEKKRKIDY
jgi:hypothetical protein